MTDKQKMNVDGTTPPMSKLRQSKGSSSTSGSGVTMAPSSAMQDRLAQLNAMQRKTTNRKKKSFDSTQSLSRTTSNANRDRYYSLANTEHRQLKKIDTERQEKHKEALLAKNRRMKKYIQSRKDIFEGVEDEKKLIHDEDGDAAMLLRDKSLSKVQDTKDPKLPAKVQDIKEQTSTDSDMKDTESTPSTSVSASVSSAESSKSQSTESSKPETSTSIRKKSATKKNAKSQSQSTAAPKRIIMNPSVATSAYDGTSNIDNDADNSTTKDKKAGLFGGFFKKKNNQNTDGDIDNAPKRLKYQLPNSNGEKFELYTWLKPTKLLGEGAYAAVCEVIDTRTNKKFAIKKNRDVFSNVADARRILREIKLMCHFDHPHVMSLNGVIPPEPHDRDTYKDCYLIMPKMDTTLSKVIRSKQKLSERHIQYFIYQIARGLEYMHSGGIIHRDLKPENVLVNAVDCKIKITDFGLSRGVRIDVDSPQKLTEYVVTRWYRAPEVMCCSRLYDYQIDVWALGCISAELYTRRPLFKGRNHIEQLQLIFHFMGKPDDLSWITTADAKKWIKGMPDKAPQDVAKMLPGSSATAQKFINDLLTVNPHKRPDVTGAINHEWLKEFAREKDYRKCPVFNISFEYEASIKTAFGVRHMMYTELHSFHNKLTKKEEERSKKYRQLQQKK